MKCRRFTSKAEKAPGNRLLPDHLQTALPLLPRDWAEKSFVFLLNRQIAAPEVLWCVLYTTAFAWPYLLGSFEGTFILISPDSGEISKR